MASITTEIFEDKKQVQVAGTSGSTIYTIVSVEFINTQYREACISTLSDETKVFAPSALVNRLKRETEKPFPRFVRPKGRVQSKKNPA